MPVEVIMPKVDMDMASGTVSAWHVEIGATVVKGDPLFDIETDKAAMEVEAQNDGVLYHCVPAGTEVAIGQPVAWLYDKNEEVGDAPVATPETVYENTTERSEPASDQAADVPNSLMTQTARTDKTRATPRARTLVREAGIDITAVTGSGPRGRIQAKDVPQTSDAAFASPTIFVPETGLLNITYRNGGTRTPIVLIHGFASDTKSWKQIEPFLAGHPLIRIDLPCHGKSPNLRISSFSDLVKTVRQTFDDLHLNGAQLIGHSLGGAVALAIADTRPGKVNSLCLIAPAGLGPDINGATLSGIAKASRAESIAPWLKTLVQDDTLISEGYVRSVMATRTQSNMRAAQIALAGIVFPDGTQAFDLKAALSRVEMPTRLIWGRRDKIIPWQHALTAPGKVAIHLFEDTGHLPHIERPEQIGKLLATSI